jgi:hypothetical protein
MAQPQSDRRSDRLVSLEQRHAHPAESGEKFERAVATLANGDELVVDIYADRVHVHGHRVVMVRDGVPSRFTNGAPLQLTPGSCSVVIRTDG